MGNIDIDEWDDRPGGRVLKGRHPGVESGTSAGVARTVERKRGFVKRRGQRRLVSAERRMRPEFEGLHRGRYKTRS
jgi:hypothetical protein